MVDLSLIDRALEQGQKRFQVLGACAVRSYIPDVVLAGTVLRIEEQNWGVCVVRDDGRIIGRFPPAAKNAYYERPDEQRISCVVVAKDVNLNDKYGQMFVYPVVATIS